MKENIAIKPASQDEITLYCYLGEALLKTQIVEQALSHSITLKMNSDVKKEQADEFLGRQLSYTLGKAIKLAQKEKLFTPLLQENLNSFLDQRNWLVHKAMAESRVDNKIEAKNESLLQKIKMISNNAEKLQHEIELDLIDFCISKGRDMSKVLAIINERYK